MLFLVVFSHSLLIHAATQLLTESLGVVQAAQAAGLLYVWRNVVHIVVSLPVGILADRFGHLPVLIAGYVLGGLTAGLTTLAISVGALGTVNGTAKFISSAAVGVLWTAVSPVFGFGLAAAVMLAGTLALARVSSRSAL